MDKDDRQIPFIIVLAAALALVLVNTSTLGQKTPERAIKGDSGALGTIIISQDMFLLAPKVPNMEKTETYGVMIDIIRCESGGDPKAKNPKSSAFGLCQFIDETWNYVQTKWDMGLDRENEDDQRYACQRLLKEEGKKHWEASKTCWDK